MTCASKPWSWIQKSGGGSVRPDKHKTNQAKRPVFAFLIDLAYDLEGLPAGAGH
ncbi:hypothetical protein V6B33_20580 [Mangrovibacillus sp. Mu-81]|uniref:hypothetical protein n=1 Tax=Mangrovibacillus sp. Mu-81 TaxID=3121478 RepID=UPI002FE47343